MKSATSGFVEHLSNGDDREYTDADEKGRLMQRDHKGKTGREKPYKVGRDQQPADICKGQKNYRNLPWCGDRSLSEAVAENVKD